MTLYLRGEFKFTQSDVMVGDLDVHLQSVGVQLAQCALVVLERSLIQYKTLVEGALHPADVAEDVERVSGPKTRLDVSNGTFRWLRHRWLTCWR